MSVRNAAEALAALKGGAPIVDVKEPSHGPLGRASRQAQGAVVVVVESVKLPHGPPLVTAALGELLEEKAPRGRPLSGIHLYKVGLGGCAGLGWEALLDRRLRWIARAGPGAALAAVAYADHERAKAPEPGTVLAYAAARRLPFILVDTFDKRTGSLRENLGDGVLRALIREAHAAGVRIALAGSLRAADIESLASLGPDVLAVRGAACVRGERDLDVDPRRVAALVARIEAGSK